MKIVALNTFYIYLVRENKYCRRRHQRLTSQKHAYTMLTPLNPTSYNKTGVYRGYTLFIIFLLKTKIVGTR